MTQQFNFDFLGNGIMRSRCNVRIFSDDGEHFILFENLGIGTSVTNASEQLASAIVQKMGYDPDDCEFFETYKENDYKEFDRITYTWKDNEAHNAHWTPALEEIKNLFLG